jgi:hypothetical protein
MFTKGNKVNLGRQFSEEHKQKMALSKHAEKNPMWKGDIVGIDGLHEWLKRRLSRPDVCNLCSKPKKLELCNVSNKYDPKTYTREFKNWKWFCYSCHMKTDGRLEKLQKEKGNLSRDKKGRFQKKEMN